MMRCLCVWIAILSLVSASAVGAATVVAPNSLANTEGSTNNCYPFTCTTSMRYQQGYDASFFGASPIAISAIAFRVDGGPLAEDFQRLVELQIDLSTSANQVGSLSTTFANNLGADDTIVFAHQTVLLSGTSGSAPNPFDVVFALDTPFVYDPSAGDLLMDVRIFGATAILPLLENPILDATTGPSSQLQRVYWNSDVNSTFGISDPGGGLVTQFTFVPEPGTAALLALGLIGLARPTGKRRGGASLP